MSKNEYVVGENTTPKRIQRGPMGGGGGRSFEKPKNFKSSILHLLNYCKKYWIGLSIALFFTVISTILYIASPSFLSQITDTIEKGIATGIDMTLINNLALVLVIMLFAGLFINYAIGFIMATVTQRLAKSLRTDLSKKINNLPLSYFDKTTYGDILSRITNDVDTVSHTLNQSLTGLISGVIMIIGSAIMMFITNWILALTAIFSSLIGFMLMTLIIGKSQRYFMEQQKFLGEVNGHIEEIYAGHNVVKVYNAEEEEKVKFNEINQKLRQANWKAQFISGIMQPLMGFIGSLGYLVVCVVGGALAFGGYIGFGVIVSFMLYIRMFTQPLTQIAQVATQMQSAAASSERVFEFLHEKEMLKDNSDAKLETIVGDISFEHVKFGYDKDKIIINDFSCDVKGGQKIAIVGPTGAGKTTMVNLLMRFYELNDGDIKIDKVPIANLSRHNLHNLFGMVLQDTWLFEGSIKDNIKYSKATATDEDVV
ncbi:MAG: ABC transporter ATP-binding protein, partial [Clostridia bacterium]